MTTPFFIPKIFGTHNSILSRAFRGAKFFLVGSIFLVAACKKESDIGLDVQPTNDLIGLSTSDTTTLLAYAVREDSLRSDESTVIQIGAYRDPVFGNATASLYSQLVFPNGQQNVNFNTTVNTFDSCALHLSYDYDYYGDTLGATAQQTFNVYQLDQDIYKDSSYYSNQTKTTSTLIGSTGSFSPMPRTKVAANGDTSLPYLRIPMDSTWGASIFYASATDLATIPAFLAFKKGIYIRPDTSNIQAAAMLRFLPQDSLTRFTLYYHDTAGVQHTYSLVINSDAAYFSHFTHNYSTATQGTLLSQLGTGQSGAFGYTETYLQSMSGIKTKIEFPFLDDWKNLGYKIAINKAELVIKADPFQASTSLPINKQVYLTYLDTANTQYLLPDMFESSVYYGGTVNTTASEYRINMARYFQRVMNGEFVNNGLFLKEISGIEQGRRAVLGTHFSTGYKMYLHLVYTRIN